MILQTWIVQGKATRLIIVATDEHWAQTYAEQAGIHEKVELVTQPSVFFEDIEPDAE